MNRFLPALEGLALLALTLPLALALHVPTIWFLSPVLVILVTRREQETYGLTLHNAGSFRFHLVTGCLVFVPYMLGHYLWGTFWLGAQIRPRLPDDFLLLCLNQVMAIGLPEEMFFRGYLQTQFDQVWGRPYRFYGASFGWGLVLAALLFAVCHIFNGGPARLIVFFPALLYGWLRARTDSIAVPALYHAFSNLLMQIMLTSFAP